MGFFRPANDDDQGGGSSDDEDDVVADEVADGVVLVTYVAVRGESAVGRSSLWLEHEGRMRIRWHQGTALRADTAPDPH